MYRKHILIQPQVIPNYIRYIQWATLLDLLPKELRLLGPFNFEDITEENRPRSKVPWERCEELYNLCKRFELVPTNLTWNEPKDQ